MRLDRKLMEIQRYEEMKVFLNKTHHHTYNTVGLNTEDTVKCIDFAA